LLPGLALVPLILTHLHFGLLFLIFLVGIVCRVGSPLLLLLDRLCDNPMARFVINRGVW
jgi:hypothetical protein